MHAQTGRVRPPVDREELDGLPGEALLRRGLEDLARGRLSAEALTLALAETRLAQLGVDLETDATLPAERELALYTGLAESGANDPYARYNALRRELDGLLEALEARRRCG